MCRGASGASFGRPEEDGPGVWNACSTTVDEPLLSGEAAGEAAGSVDLSEEDLGDEVICAPRSCSSSCRREEGESNGPGDPRPPLALGGAAPADEGDMSVPAGLAWLLLSICSASLSASAMSGKFGALFVSSDRSAMPFLDIPSADTLSRQRDQVCA